MINKIYSDENNIWDKGAEILVGKLEAYIKEGKRCLLLLSGGSSVSVYQKLSEKIENIKLRPDSLVIAQVDERFQPENDFDVNAAAIEKSGLTEKLEGRKIPFYKIPQTGTLREAAFSYDKLFKKLFVNYDCKIAVLGIGQDGHTAGLLRGYRSEWDKDRMAAGYENRGEFKERITITPKALGMIDYGLICVLATEKKVMVERILNKESDDINNLPGLLIHKIKEVDLVRDS